MYFYLKKRGLWYRPGAKGYTANLLEAGRFAKPEVAERCTIEGVTAHSESDVKNEVWKEMQASLKRTAELAALWERLEQR